MRRTNTTNLTTFTLPSPREVTFDFTSSSSSSPAPAAVPNAVIRITIPPSSKWRMPFHWHPSEKSDGASVAALGCDSVTCVSGFLHVHISTSETGYDFERLVSDGVLVKFPQGGRIGWGRDESRRSKDPASLVVELVADHTLWRNICSAVLDMAIFPQLTSTPWWLKKLFAILTFRPAWRDALLRAMLWFQLQTSFYAHDFRMYHGRIPVTTPWWLVPGGKRPPEWALRLQLRTLLFIAWAVMTTAYWTGTLFLGMKGEYVEYTPSGEHRDKKH